MVIVFLQISVEVILSGVKHCDSGVTTVWALPLAPTLAILASQTLSFGA